MTTAIGAAVAIGKAINLAIPTIQAGIQIANFIRSSADLWQAGYLTEAQLLEMWKATGVSVAAASDNLKAAMDEARGKPT